MAFLFFLLSFVFFVFAIIGLINPKKGSFWLFFDKKEKKRLRVFGINIIVSFILFVVFLFSVPNDYYRRGVSHLESKEFMQSIESFKKIPEDNEYYNQKDELINKVYTDAKRYYSETILAAIKNLNSNMAKSCNHDYQALTGELLYNDNEIDNQITENIDELKKQIEKYFKSGNYEQVMNLALILSNVVNEKTYATNVINEINEIRKNIDIENNRNQLFNNLTDNKFTEAKNNLENLSKLGIDQNSYNELMDKIINHENKYIERENARIIADYKKNALFPAYGDILRNPKKYQNKIVSVKGEIVSKINTTTYQVATGYELYQGVSLFDSTIIYFGDNIVFKYKGDGIIVGDVVEIFGSFLGIETYSSLLGGKEDIPEIKAEIVDVRFAKH